MRRGRWSSSPWPPPAGSGSPRVLGERAVALGPEIVELYAVHAQQQLPALGEARVPPRGQGHRLTLEIGDLSDVGRRRGRELPHVGIVIGHEQRLVGLLALPAVGAGA